MNIAARLQPLGRSLMLPIAVLPIAGLLLRLGQPDLLDLPFVAAAGSAVFENLGLLFAIGIAVGFARDGNGAAGLAGVVCYLVATHGARTLLPVSAADLAALGKDASAAAIDALRARAIDRLSVPIGILSGVIAGASYNRYAAIRLPDYLSFFGGRRFVPIVAGLAGVLLAALVGIAYTTMVAGMDAVSEFVLRSGGFGLFLYGFLNRLLIVTGLHHLLNNFAWFLLGDFHGATGDLNRFFAGDPSAGAFMSGFFPIMMFGLPAACMAMYHEARPERRRAVGGMLLSMGLTAFLTGVTEPIEFSFMFLAPLLYLLHALLTGVAMALMAVFDVKLGFGFSAGAIDYVLNFNRATNPLLLLPIGLVYGGVYYASFRFAIRMFDLKTPGREVDGTDSDAAGEGTARGAAFVAALGGSANLAAIDACTTRLRLVVRDQALVDELRLTALGARGIVRLPPDRLQVVLGPMADNIASEMREAGMVPAGGEARSAVGPQAAAPPLDSEGPEVGEWIAALGGAGNIREVRDLHSRLRIEVVDSGAIDTAKLLAEGARAVRILAGETVHILVRDARSLAFAFRNNV